MEDLELLEQEINEQLNLVFLRYAESDSIIFKNLRDLKKLLLLTEENLFTIYKKYDNYKIDYEKVSKVDFVEKIGIIDVFFASLGIPFDTSKILVDGTFDIETNEEQGTLKMPENDGYYSKNNEHFSISVVNNGLITDAVVWLHEITHYRHLSEKDYNISANYLTEALAFTYEFIFLDYLQNRGYNYEASMIKMRETLSLFYRVYDCYYILQLFILYDTFGLVSKENYEELFKKDNYENVINRFSKIAKERSLRTIIEYSFAALLSIYMYEEYKKDNSFLANIEKFCSEHDLSLDEYLRIIGFVSNEDEGLLNETNAQKIEKAIQRLEEEINRDFMEIDQVEKSI